MMIIILHVLIYLVNLWYRVCRNIHQIYLQLQKLVQVSYGLKMQSLHVYKMERLRFMINLQNEKEAILKKLDELKDATYDEKEPYYKQLKIINMLIEIDADNRIYM